MNAPPLGLLLDVDGPVSSPVTRTVAAPLLADVAALLAAGIPVVLNTGRSSDFVHAQVFTPLARAGLPPGPRLHAICEKGGVWTSARDRVVHTDPALAVPGVVRELYERLVGDGYRDAMFVDRTKRVMATAEARTDVPSDHYLERQRAFDGDLLAGLTAAGLGVRLRRDRYPDADGRTPWRIDPSVIATDVEAAASGKALGARRALALLADAGPLPRTWHTVGDSRSDYARPANCTSSAMMSPTSTSAPSHRWATGRTPSAWCPASRTSRPARPICGYWPSGCTPEPVEGADPRSQRLE